MLQRVLVLLAVLALTVSTATTSFAAVFDYTDPNTRMEIRLGALAPIFIPGSFGVATVSGADLQVDAGIFQTSGLGAGTSLFTGVALLTDLIVTVSNGSANFTGSFDQTNPLAGAAIISPTPYSGDLCPGGCLGGTQVIDGQTIVGIGAPPGFNPVIPFDVVGVGGVQIAEISPNLDFVITGAPFVTGKIRITGITSNVVQLPGRPVGEQTGPAIILGATSMEQVRTFTTQGGFLTSATGTPMLEVVNTVTLSGANSLTGGGEGQVTLITPLRVNTGVVAGTIPGYIAETFVFVPEPGTLLLLASGAAGLVMIGRRRSRK